MAHRSRARVPKPKGNGQSVPETMAFYITADLERSGLHFLPIDSHLRAPDGSVPDQVDSMGYCPTTVQEGMPPKVGNTAVKVAKDSTVTFRIVENATGDPYEWTAQELYEAIYPGDRRAYARPCLMPVNPHDPAFGELMARGKYRSGRSRPNLIPPSKRGPRPHEPEPGIPYLPETGRGYTVQPPGSEGFMNPSPLRGWVPPNVGQPIRPEQYPGNQPGGRR